MPAPAKTSDRAVVEAARRVVEEHGAAGLTMKAVAEAVGVRQPSLYKRFRDRDALLAAVELDAFARIGRIMAGAAEGRSPRDALEAQARAFRRFAAENPGVYAIIYGRESLAGPEAEAARRGAVAPVLATLAALVGEARALSASRTLVSFLHGFVSIERAKLFRLGGDVGAAFEDGLALILDAIEARAKEGR